MLPRLRHGFVHLIDGARDVLSRNWNAFVPETLQERLLRYANAAEVLGRSSNVFSSGAFARLRGSMHRSTTLRSREAPLSENGGHVMQLYLVRHGIAVEDAGRMPDTSRPLTEKGRRRFQKTARAFGKLGGRIDVILTSPLVRAVQTAEILAGATDHREVGILEELDPKFDVEKLRSAIASRAGKAKTVAIVGHEPQLSSLLATLAGVAQADIDLKKGAIVRLDLATLTGGAAADARWWLKPKGARAKGLPLHGKAKTRKASEAKAAKGQHARKKKRRAKRGSSAENAGAAVPEMQQPVLGGAEA